MRTELTMQALVKTLKAQHENKRDFIVNTTTAKMAVFPVEFESGDYGLSFKGESRKGKVKREEHFTLNRYALGQIAAHTKVPMQMIDLLAKGTVRERIALGNVLSVRLQENEAKRMIRTMQNEPTKTSNPDAYCRAFLSDKYRVIDNWDLAQEAVMPTLAKLKDLKIESLAVTDERLYIKALVDDGGYDIGTGKVNDIVKAGIVISNSEVGAGSFAVEPLVFYLRCTNGMISREYGMRKNHVGRTHEAGDFASYEMFSDETRALDDAAFFSKVRDTIRGTVGDEEMFMKIVQKFSDSRDDRIAGQPQAAVTELAKRFTLNENETQGIMAHLIEGGDLSRFGMVNAVTAYARDDKREMSYDRATQFEKMGGEIITLGESEWKIIANAKVATKPSRKG